MPDQPPSERFKSEMPQIPGVTVPITRVSADSPSAKLMIGLVAAVLFVVLGTAWALRPKHAAPKAMQQQPRIEVPPPAPDPSTLIPHATDANPGIATIVEMAKPWSSKQFYFRNRLSGEDIPAILVRLPTKYPSHASGYWAFSLNSAYGDCKLEYVTDLAKLKTEYDFRDAKHPMAGNPCSRTVFDPLKMTTLPGVDVFVRGAIAQGSDLRPPLGIEIQVRGKDILAVRAE